MGAVQEKPAHEVLMNIEEFLDQDILVYLDRRLEQSPEQRRGLGESPTAFLTRDYEKEFFRSLDNSNVHEAKHVLHDLKEKFDELPTGTAEKNQIRMLLTDLYEKFKDYLDTEQTFTRMDQELARAEPIHHEHDGRAGGKQERPGKTHKPQEKTAGRPDVPKPMELAEKTPSDERDALPVPADDPLIEHANKTLDKAEQVAAQGDKREAIRLYRVARQDVLKLSMVPDSLALRFKESFSRIQSMLKKDDLDDHLLMELERLKHDLDRELEEQDIAAAMKTYGKMRMVVQQIRDEVTAETAAEKLIRIYKIITVFKEHSDDKGLTRVA